jgi:hypothetical protein
VAISPVTQPAQPLMNVSLLSTSEPDGVEHAENLNLYGFRGTTWRLTPAAPRQRIMFVGDSMVEGALTSDEETIPAAFERKGRRADMNLEALNLGIGGAQISDYVRVIRDATPIFRPDTIILVIFANDMPFPPLAPAWLRDPVTPLRTRRWMPRLLEVLRRTATGQPIPRRWHQGPFPVFAAVPHPSNPWTWAGDQPQSLVQPHIAEAMRRGRFNPFLIDWLSRIAPHLGRAGNPRPHLAALKQYVEASGASFLLVYLPCAEQISDYYLPFRKAYGNVDVRSMRGPEYQVQAAALRRSAGELGIPFLDLTEPFRRLEEQGVHLYWDYDIHMRGRGYVAAGEAIYDWWRTNQ